MENESPSVKRLKEDSDAIIGEEKNEEKEEEKEEKKEEEEEKKEEKEEKKEEKEEKKEEEAKQVIGYKSYSSTTKVLLSLASYDNKLDDILKVLEEKIKEIYNSSPNKEALRSLMSDDQLYLVD